MPEPEKPRRNIIPVTLAIPAIPRTLAIAATLAILRTLAIRGPKLRRKSLFAALLRIGVWRGYSATPRTHNDVGCYDTHRGQGSSAAGSSG